MPPFATILLAPTPLPWVDYAVEHWAELLVDHANCEKKAASTALSLLFAYPEDEKLTGAVSRVAREELRHFELYLELAYATDVFERNAEAADRLAAREAELATTPAAASASTPARR